MTKRANKCDCGKSSHSIEPWEDCSTMTKQAKHTQGKWSSEFEIDGSFWIMADKKIVASVEPRCNARANANLIASAPELLEVLIEIEAKPFPNYENAHIYLDTIREIANRAIQKARGEV